MQSLQELESLDGEVEKLLVAIVVTKLHAGEGVSPDLRKLEEGSLAVIAESQIAQYHVLALIVLKYLVLDGRQRVHAIRAKSEVVSQLNLKKSVANWITNDFGRISYHLGPLNSVAVIGLTQPLSTLRDAKDPEDKSQYSILLDLAWLSDISDRDNAACLLVVKTKELLQAMPCPITPCHLLMAKSRVVKSIVSLGHGHDCLFSSERKYLMSSHPGSKLFKDLTVHYLAIALDIGGVHSHIMSAGLCRRLGMHLPVSS